MIHDDSDLFYYIYNTINEMKFTIQINNQRQTTYLSSILNYFGIYFWVNQKLIL